MKKVVTSLVASIVLVTVLNANDYGSVDGDSITKQDIAMILQDPRIDFDKLPETAKKQVIEQIVNRKLIAKNALKNGIEKDPQYVEAMSGIKEDLALQVWQKNEVDKLKFTEQDKKDFFEKKRRQASRKGRLSLFLLSAAVITPAHRFLYCSTSGHRPAGWPRSRAAHCTRRQCLPKAGAPGGWAPALPAQRSALVG